MKPTLRKSQSGSALIITVITCALIGIVMCSYLGLITGRNQSVMRATAWNSAIPVLEAGIEEALTHLHDDKNNLAANSWTAGVVNGQTIYSKQINPWPDGSYYSVVISNAASPSPAIYSAGFVKAPLKDNEYVSRLVRVSLTNPPSLFSRAIAADGAVKLSGGAIVDGYDSAAGPYSSTNRNASGGIATNSKQQNAIDVGSGHLYGTAVTGPGGTVAVNGGSIGDLTWASSGIQDSSWVNDDMNVQFQPNSPPTGTTIGLAIGNSTNFIGSGNYKVNGDVNINSASKPIIVTGDATLWVTGNFVVSGAAPNAGYIYIAPGASLMLYVGGSTTSISGGGIINGTGLPANFSYFGLPSNKVVSYSGSANFVGTINAPQAAFTLSGGTSVYGAVICSTFTSTGGSSVHYDQGTGSKGIFLVTAWREL